MNTFSNPTLCLLLGILPCMNCAFGDSVSLPTDSFSSDTARDKGAYTLFHPTPRNLMRDMSTDRPDQTESPHTVDAGHVQIELHAFGATFDRDKGVSTREISVGSTNFKIGLLNQLDIQFIFEPYLETRTRDGQNTASTSGAGDLTSRVKINFWGNDSGSTAFAIMPYIKWPLKESAYRNGVTEWGIIPIFGFDLPGGWSGAIMPSVDWVSDDMGSYDTEYFLTATVGRGITSKLSGYLEFAARLRPESGESWQGQVDFGLAYAINQDIQLDAGCNFGITDSAPDYSPFLGISLRY